MWYTHHMLFIMVISSLVGLSVSLYLYSRKVQNKKLFCPLRTECDRVLHSSHASLFGFPNEMLGLVFYGALAVFSFLALSFPFLWTAVIHYVLLVALCASALFSVYLIIMQAFVIRAWCMWCMLSVVAQAGLVFAIVGFPLSEVALLASSHKTIWTIIHTLGFVIGLGAVTMTDVFFFRFLKDNKITFEEKGNLDTLTRVIWAGLAVLFISGVFLVLGDSSRLLASPKFLLKTILVAVIAFNGMVLNFYLSPRLQYLTLEGKTHDRSLRKVAFALGGISIFSWYGAFFLGSFRSIPVTLGQGLLVYICTLVGVVIISQMVERHFNNK